MAKQYFLVQFWAFMLKQVFSVTLSEHVWTECCIWNTCQMQAQWEGISGPADKLQLQLNFSSELNSKKKKVFFQYFIYFILKKGIQLTKCLCTYISVFRLYQFNTGSVLLDTQSYCTRDNISYITNHTYCTRYIHTYIITNIHSYSCIYH